ncbi:MAG: phosphoribosylglycinamide formyltransferase [Candidatus Omnitrophica bacterium]|nr:phosphoribosylglycinamide formyltransferase [Candidatus Omnitrophota bacterium]
MNFAVLASGKGSNLKAMIDAIRNGQIKAELKVVISDKKEAFCLEHARKALIPAIFIDPKDFKDREAFDKAVIDCLVKHQVDFVVLAGYMRLLSSFFLKQYPNKVLNIHPALLPSFKGTHAIQEAFDYGVKLTGPTVHFVTEAMDEGPIILQEAIEIKPKDTLESMAEKIHNAEHKIYPQAIDLFVRGKLKVEGRKVIVL